MVSHCWDSGSGFFIIKHYIIIFVLTEIKQHDSLTILPSPTMSRNGVCLTSLLEVHPNLSPFGFTLFLRLVHAFAFLISVTLSIILSV